MIAITVFSVAIMLVTAGVIQVGRYYQQGVTKTKLINLSRVVQANVSQDYQYSGVNPVVTNVTITNIAPHGPYGALCVGNTRYLYILHTDNFYIDTVPSPTTCSRTTISSDYQKPLPVGTRVTKFNFIPRPSGLLARLETRFVMGNVDLFDTQPDTSNYYNNNCKSSAGREFCTVVNFVSDIVRKVD